MTVDRLKITRPSNFDACPTCPIAQKRIDTEEKVVESADYPYKTTGIEIECDPSWGNVYMSGVKKGRIQLESKSKETAVRLTPLKVDCPAVNQT